MKKIRQNNLTFIVTIAFAMVTGFLFSKHMPDQISISEASQYLINGRELIAKGQIIAGANLIEKSAAAYYSAGELRRAASLYMELFNTKELPLVKHLNFGRMSGQALMEDGNSENDAQTIWERILKEANGIEPDEQSRDIVNLACGQACMFLAKMYREKGEYEAAIGMRNKLVGEYANIPLEGVVSNSIIENARDYLVLGKRSDAVTEYDNYLERHPDAGLNVWHSRALAYGYQWGTDEHQDLMKSLWNDPRHTGDVWRYNVGRELLGSLVVGGSFQEAIKLAGELERRLSELTQEEISKLPPYIRDSIKTSHSECLYYLAEAQFKLKMRDDGIITLQKLVDLFPNTPSGSYAKNELAMVKKAGLKRVEEEIVDSIDLQNSQLVTNKGPIAVQSFGTSGEKSNGEVKDRREKSDFLYVFLLLVFVFPFILFRNKRRS